MKAQKLYDQLEKDFIADFRLRDIWDGMEPLHDLITDNFKERAMGLLGDYTTDINKVYTAVFPTPKVMQEILDQKEQNAMLFLHHPLIWDLKQAPNVFQNMDRELLEQFHQNHISLYCLHSPLDNYSEYSTSASLAKALGLVIDRPAFSYEGGLAGVICTSNAITVTELRDDFARVLGHEAKLYDYGDDEIRDLRLAVVAGGGLDLDILAEIVDEDINTFVTGVTAQSDYARPAHQYAETNEINILGGTHYSTEKFACMAMCGYFESTDLPCEFIEEAADLADL
ncbi:Nif3-like dinuclear metal center hexameric protein [Patescibacteria group bacterium]